LLSIANIRLKDAAVKGLSSDSRFSLAYDAALQLATIPLLCKGYRTSGIGHHATVFESLKSTMGPLEAELAKYFDACRNKRNRLAYEAAGKVTLTEAKALLRQTKEFRETVVTWLKANFPEYTKQR